MSALRGTPQGAKLHGRSSRRQGRSVPTRRSLDGANRPTKDASGQCAIAYLTGQFLVRSEACAGTHGRVRGLSVILQSMVVPEHVLNARLHHPNHVIGEPAYVAVAEDWTSLNYGIACDAHAKQLPGRWNVCCTWLGDRQCSASSISKACFKS